VLFHSVAQEFGLTTLDTDDRHGDDGARARRDQGAGGMTIAQSEDTCVVSGMPRAAILKGYANKIVRSMDSALFDQKYGAERGAATKSKRTRNLK